MKPRRRRRRSRRETGLSSLLLAAFVSVLVIGGIGLPAASFTTAETPRSASADVVDDADAAHGLDVARVVHANATDPLVNVTNRLGHAATITVSLGETSATSGTLVIDGSTVGDEATIPLGAGETRAVSVRLSETATTADSVTFHVNATSGGLQVTATNRQVPISS